MKTGRRRVSCAPGKKQDSHAGPSLRRSTREKEQMHLRVSGSPAGSPKTQRMTRRARGLPARSLGSSVDLCPAQDHDGDVARGSSSSTLSEAGGSMFKEKPQSTTQECSATASDEARTGRVLTAVQESGKCVIVRLVVGGQPYFHNRYRKTGPGLLFEKAPKKSAHCFLGQDGNLFYCVMCRGFGDVVCCDGCPHVYHPRCIPLGSASRLSLENDDDPWYCPECQRSDAPCQPTGPGRSEGSGRRTIKHRCRECQQTRTDLMLLPCRVCQVHVHHPSCRGSTAPPSRESSSVLCSSCRVEAALSQEEMELHQVKRKHFVEDRRSRSTEVNAMACVNIRREDMSSQRAGSKNERKTNSAAGGWAIASHENNDTIEVEHVENASAEQEEDGQAGMLSPDTIGKERRKKKKRKRDSDAHLPSDEVTAVNSLPEVDMPRSVDFSKDSDENLNSAQGPPTQATPAFHFFLAEQRPKIEKYLSKRHRYFHRLPKGGERNALIAKEAALQWVKLSPTDQKKYVDLSMHDYESRIIKWKEEKNIKDMVGKTKTNITDLSEDVGGHEQADVDDDILTFEMHERLYLGTSVGSKPYKPEPDQSHNRVLLDLLRDMRFHPLPLFSASRTEMQSGLDPSKISIQHFDVHGPIATSVGDECLGCTRGWPHFCPVLRRRIPAVEHRSKLQPAASALVSCRVGLGLRPHLERFERGEQNEDYVVKECEMLVWRDAPNSNELQNVRFVPSGSLSAPSARADDVVQFIEEVVAMKIPVPLQPNSVQGGRTAETIPKKLGRGTLPTRQKRSSDVPATDQFDNFLRGNANKCGRCRTIIMNESGCVQCRRAQLVINMSKRQPLSNSEHQLSKKGDSRLLKVQTAMLGRVITKEMIGEAQLDSDRKISGAILKERWMPCSVMPAAKALSPAPVKIAERKFDTADGRVQEVTPEDAGGLAVAEEASIVVCQRGTRRTSVPPAAFDSHGTERQVSARHHREALDRVSKRCLSIACHGILLALIRRDPLLLFAQPVTAEGYSAVVKKPIDFSRIRNSVLNNGYSTLGAFVADVRLLCENALVFNPPGSIYSRTAKKILDGLLMMQKRSCKWISAIKNTHTSFWRKFPKNCISVGVAELSSGDPLTELRQTWPEAVNMYENSTWVRNLLISDFTRTNENETAFYGSLAVRRAAKAAEVSLAPYTDTGGCYAAVVKRSHTDDEKLRESVDSKIGGIVDPVLLRDIASGREESIVRLMRRVQSRRLERRIGSENGCVRCDGVGFDHEMKAVMNADARWGKNKKKWDSSDSEARVAPSRIGLTTGLASARTRELIANFCAQTREVAFNAVNDVCVSLRGSRIHGWGLFAEQPFKKGEVVAEYVGEVVGLPLANAREKTYEEMRIQDYQFRLDDSQIIDATMKGGLARYINHNCNPNCITKIIPGRKPNHHLRRVLILAQEDISPRDELTYDYQFPLELNLEARIPCNCQSDTCRGFMNWDLPEKGANTGAIRTQKRGANMRDRIRRLGRPLKK